MSIRVNQSVSGVANFRSKYYSLVSSNRLNREIRAAAAYSQSRNNAYYWSAEKASAEIDFIFQSEMNIVPLEVKVFDERSGG